MERYKVAVVKLPVAVAREVVLRLSPLLGPGLLKPESFGMKTNRAITLILNENRPTAKIRSYLSSDKYAITLHVDTYYKDCSFGVKYHSAYCMFGSNGEVETISRGENGTFKTDYNIEDVLIDMELIKEHEAKIEISKDFISVLQNDITDKIR